MMKKTLCALLLGTAMLLSGCNSASDSANRVAGSAPGAVFDDYSFSEKSESGGLNYAVEEDALADMEFSSTTSSPGSGTVSDTRKIIRTANLTVQTKQFDQAAAQIPALAAQLGGYVESSSVSGNSYDAGDYSIRSASFTLRIPSARLDAYLDSLGGDPQLFNITERNLQSEDITDVYFDAESRLKSLQTQEERLLAMLEKAEDLEYMIQLENALADVRYQIENYYSAIQRYDSQVSMSSVSILLREVAQYQSLAQAPKTYGERLSIAFVNSWSGFVDDLGDFFIDIVYMIPGLLVLIVLFCCVFFPLRRTIRRRKQKKLAAYAAACQPQPQPTDEQNPPES